MSLTIFITICYIISSVLFVIGLKRMSSPVSARKANQLSAVGMLIAIVATLLTRGMMEWQWIAFGLAVGTGIGILAATRVAMTSMPQMVGLLNGSGGLASFIVGWAAYHYQPESSLLTTISTYLAVLIGGVTFTGSFIAWAKLEEKFVTGKPILFAGQKIVNSLLLGALIVGGIIFCLHPDPADNYPLFVAIMVLSLILGVMVVIPIGGADMPVVISLLNSYSGMAGAATGFVIINSMLIVAGSLVGASGIILTRIMCKAMNRSLTNVLFSGFGSVTKKAASEVKGEAKAISVKDAYYVLEAARSVVFVPGYGMAVAQAQHAVRELGKILENNGAEVRYAIHPVAGRMPGHMNVLLAEADVPYDQLFEMDAINPIIDTIDVAVVIGANDVVNPAARHDKSSPIYGMPIINVDKAKTVFVLKRSMRSGFAGIENELFYYDNTRMVFGDAKETVQALIAEFKSV
ncbi:MAG: NAD(P)(+) transhydrogenase (Re/Si-specific) subunit beta [Candidatus Omnitrophica bacterium]|nr:NAD(P)(+) transhydrogenase (Re/Si-specific) subunit beta [Candidatus Omnitrophota bacterium]